MDSQRARILAAVAFGAGIGFAACTFFNRTKSPTDSISDPIWRPGKKQPPPFPMYDTVSLTPDELKSKYKFFISAWVPRSIALVSTISDEGHINISPFSYSGIMCHDPPTVIFSCVDKNRGGGDTLKNVKQTREFVTHIMSEWFLESANHTCGNFDPDVNEFEESGLTQVPSDLIKPPRCAEAAVQMECRVQSIQEITKDDGKVSCTMVVGRIVKVHVNRGVYDAEKGVVKSEALRPMSRLGGNTYGTLGKTIDLPRPKVGSRAADGGANAKNT